MLVVSITSTMLVAKRAFWFVFAGSIQRAGRHCSRISRRWLPSPYVTEMAKVLREEVPDLLEKLRRYKPLAKDGALTGWWCLQRDDCSLWGRVRCVVSGAGFTQVDSLRRSSIIWMIKASYTSKMVHFGLPLPVSVMTKDRVVVKSDGLPPI